MSQHDDVPNTPADVNFNVSEHYLVESIIGEGAYGVVWSVFQAYANLTRLSSLPPRLTYT